MALKISKELKESLGEDIVKLLEEKAKTTDILVGVDGNYIPKDRFDEVNKDKNDMKAANDKLTKDLADASKGVKSTEELTAKITELTASNKKIQEEADAKVAARELSYMIDGAVKGAKAKNSKAIQGMFDMTAVKVVDGKLVGLDAQIEAIKKSDPYLFDVEQKPETKLDQFGKPINNGDEGGKTNQEQVNAIVTQMGFTPPVVK
jgi:predicted CopG family antitoxin